MIIKYPNIFPEDPALKLQFNNELLESLMDVELHIDVRMFSREPNKKYYCLDLETPNSFVFDQTRNDYINHYEKLYDRIITICPFTAKLRNESLGKELYSYGYFPSSSNWNRDHKKEFDLIYMGSGTDWFLDDRILKYSHVVINAHGRHYTTHPNLSFNEKMDMVSKSRITLVHNQINCSHIYPQEGTDNFYKIINNRLTQHKSRVVEAARAKSLILCKKDDFNIIEDLFIPNQDFVYYNDDNFDEVVSEILNNYSDYQFMIDNAFKKVSTQYDIKNFVEKFII